MAASAKTQAAVFDDNLIRCSWLARPKDATQRSTAGAPRHRGARPQGATASADVRMRRSGRPAAALPRHRGARYQVGDLDIDLQDRDLVAAFQPDLDPFGRHVDMLGDHAQDVLAQHGDQPRLAGRAALMRQQDLKALARQRGGAAPGEKLKQPHAALLPNSRVSNGWRALGMVIGTVSPRSRRAASL